VNRTRNRNLAWDGAVQDGMGSGRMRRRYLGLVIRGMCFQDRLIIKDTRIELRRFLERAEFTMWNDQTVLTPFTFQM